MRRTTFPQAIALLERSFGAAKAPVDDPFAFVLLEQVAYLASDEQRASAFAALRDRVGIAPEAILGAPAATLLAVCTLGGIHAQERAERLKRSASIVLEECDGDLGALARMPLAAARKLARRFDGFGAANAETLLLVAGVPVPALDSNGVRVVARLWFGGESPRYAADHKRGCEAIAADGPFDQPELLRGYLTLRRHGRTICRRSAPACPSCPLQSGCDFTR